MSALRFKLGGRTAGPAAAKEEHNRGQRLRGFLRGLENPDLQLGVADLAIGLGLRAFDDGWMAASFLLGGFFLGARGQRNEQGEQGEGEAHGVTRGLEGPRTGGKEGKAELRTELMTALRAEWRTEWKRRWLNRCQRAESRTEWIRPPPATWGCHPPPETIASTFAPLHFIACTRTRT